MLQTGYYKIITGLLFTTIHINLAGLEIFPNFFGIFIIAWGCYELAKAEEKNLFYKIFLIAIGTGIYAIPAELFQGYGSISTALDIVYILLYYTICCLIIFESVRLLQKHKAEREAANMKQQLKIYVIMAVLVAIFRIAVHFSTSLFWSAQLIRIALVLYTLYLIMMVLKVVVFFKE